MRRLALVLIAIGATSSSALMKARADGCTVRGDRVVLQDVTVRSGPVPFVVHLDGVPAQVRLGPRRRASVRIQVNGSIAFTGWRRNVWLTIGRPLTLAQGMVTLDRGAKVVEARLRGDEVLARPVLQANDVLAGEDKDPDETLGPIPIPCDALTLDEGPEEEDQDVDDANAANGPNGPDTADRWWAQRRSRRSVTLKAAARDDAAELTVATVVHGAKFWFEHVDERGPWVRVSRAASGVRATGWVRRAELEPLDGPEGSGGGCHGDHGRGLAGRGWGGKPPKTIYRGPARLRPGTKLTNHGEIWATVIAPDGFEVELFEREGRRFVEITHIPGVVAHAWEVEVDPAALLDVPTP